MAHPPIEEVHNCPEDGTPEYTGPCEYGGDMRKRWECTCGAVGWEPDPEPIKVIDYTEFDPGIRGVVFKMRRSGFNTTDSGDGSKHPEMGCALPFPHAYALGEPRTMVEDCRKLRQKFPEAVVQATYSPDDGMVVLMVMWPESDAEAVLEAHPYPCGD